MGAESRDLDADTNQSVDLAPPQLAIWFDRPRKRLPTQLSAETKATRRGLELCSGTEYDTCYQLERLEIRKPK